MAAVNRVYAARLAGMVVLGPDGESIGRVRDVVISIGVLAISRGYWALSSNCSPAEGFSFQSCA